MLNKTFPIVYQGKRYLVDPTCLIQSSAKFHELITPFLHNGFDIDTLHLKINYDKFTERNVNNFLKLCQNLQTDVQNSEIKEICLLAKMFKAEIIYKTGITFVQQSIDPNFVIPNNMFNEENVTFLLIESEQTVPSATQSASDFQIAPEMQTAPIVRIAPEIKAVSAMETAPTVHMTPIGPATASVHHVYDLNELEFDESGEFKKVGQNLKFNNQAQNSTDKKNEKDVKKKKIHSVWYTIQVEKPLMKCKRYNLIKDGQVICSAKQKDNELVIAEGDKVHIRNDKKNSAIITQNREGFNIVSMGDQDFKISYVPIGLDKKYSMKVSFVHKTTKLTWTPKIPKYATCINGEYAHIPLHSKKNIILQNPFGHPTFILRKMKKMAYEAECHPGVSPLVVFAISLSQIVGPYSP